MKNINAISILIRVNVILLVFLQFACEESTKPETVTFSGTVILEGETDFSGVKVSLYEPVELDTTLLRINQQYPQIGVQISQETEFDHREHSPLYSTTTNAYGSWKIENITPGTYNIVAEKDSFGWKYILESKKGNVTGIELYKETYLTGIISSNLTFLTNRHYVVNNDLTIQGSLNIEAGAVIRIAKDKKIIIDGNLIATGSENNYTWFTSNDGVENWNKIQIERNSQIELAWCRFDFVNNGIESHGNILDLRNCRIKSKFRGITCIDADSVICQNLIVYSTLDTTYWAMFFERLVSGKVSKNIVLNSESGINFKDHCQQANVENNYISKCENGIDISFYSFPTINNNNITECTKNILVSGNSEPFIHHNSINGNINFYIYYVQASQLFEPCPQIENNNFGAQDYYYYLEIWSRKDIITINNYYGISINQIPLKIKDKQDYPPEQQEKVGNVIYQPISSPNETCGIQ